MPGVKRIRTFKGRILWTESLRINLASIKDRQVSSHLTVGQNLGKGIGWDDKAKVKEEDEFGEFQSPSGPGAGLLKNLKKEERDLLDFDNFGKQ